MAGTCDQISNFMFGTKKPYNLDIWPRFRPYGVFTLQKPYKSGFSHTSSSAGVNTIPPAHLACFKCSACVRQSVSAGKFVISACESKFSCRMHSRMLYSLIHKVFQFETVPQFISTPLGLTQYLYSLHPYNVVCLAD